MTELNGRVAIITGASSGIGAATAKALEKQGVKVVNSGSGIGVSADAGFPNSRAIREVETIQVALLGADVRVVVDDGKAAFH